MSKITTLENSAARIHRENSDAGELANIVLSNLHLDADLGDMLKTGDEILHLRAIKEALKISIEAVNEWLDELNEIQWGHMVESEMQSFNRKGSVLYLKETVFVKSNVGYDDEALIAQLTENGLGDLAKAKVNAQSFGAAMREMMKTQDETGVESYDESLLPTELRDMLTVTRVGEVGIRKAGK
jgi:archaeosine-15-forming tRNA-guanine transglycosylase